MSYPGIAKIFAGITLVLIVLSVVGIWLKKYVLATITSIASVITFLATGTTLGNIVNPALAAAGIQQSVSVKYLTYQAAYYLQIILLILLAVFIYWLSGGEQLAKRLFLIAATISIASVLVITIYMLIIGLPAMIEIGPLKFLFGTVWDPTNSTLPQFGILPMILTSIFCTILSILIGVPVGILTAVFLAEIAPKWVVNIVHPAVELLAGIPSVIYGFFALQILSPFVKRVFDLPSGDTMLTATIVLAIMILPTIITTCESGLNAVPDLYREASLAMGASRIRTIFKIVIPAARSAILSGVILGVGRSIGETMAIIMVAGNSPQMPNLLGSVRPMTVGIVMEMSYATGLHRDSLFSIGLVLFVFIMIVNFLFTWISKKGVQLDGKN
ncbi:MAG: phosphate ABC transporter permease subunit PstC [Clostridiaceae bacterium]|nr:phosphate ABC transporter permease subunit PstC [Clostridiaceae bacterium]